MQYIQQKNFKFTFTCRYTVTPNRELTENYAFKFVMDYKNGSNLIKSSVTALHFAAYYGEYKEVVRVLINHNASLKAKHKNGNTPVHLAASLGRRIVLQSNPDLNCVKNTLGDTPLHLVSSNDRTKRY